MKFCGFCGMGTISLQFPFAAPFLWNDPFWDEIMLCRKTIFQAPIFFAHAWTASSPLKIHAWCDCERQKKADQENHILADARGCAKQHTPPAIELVIFKPEAQHANHFASGPLPPKNFAFLFSLWVGCKGLGFGLGCGCEKKQFFRLWKIVVSHFPSGMILNEPFWLQGSSQALRKNNFSRPEKLFFLALPLWDSEMRCCNSSFSVPGQTYQTSPALQKKHQALKDCFFGMPLAKPANSTSLPRLTSLEIAQIYIYIHTYIVHN